MLASAARRVTIAGAALAAGCMIAGSVAVSAHGASQPQRRQIGAVTLSAFKIVLSARRGGPGHTYQATVTAKGYERSGSGWKLMAAKRIGKADSWEWFSVGTCALTATQSKNNVEPSPPVVRYDSIRVSLLFTPAVGCTRAYAEHWQPAK
jgi:hypothetical protein